MTKRNPLARALAARLFRPRVVERKPPPTFDYIIREEADYYDRDDREEYPSFYEDGDDES